jgi:hypothetical protein
MNLTSAFDHAAGYHGTAWVDLGDGVAIDRPVPDALREFIDEVADLRVRRGIPEAIGTAYMRIIDAGHPENYMHWHRDNQDGGVRFHTAISTDGAQVCLAWATSDEWEGRPVAETPWRTARLPINGEVTVFTTELHGVLPLPPRPGELTAVFFVTLYADRETADLYTTNNCATTTTADHAALPVLEATR